MLVATVSDVHLCKLIKLAKHVPQMGEYVLQCLCFVTSHFPVIDAQFLESDKIILADNTEGLKCYTIQTKRKNNKDLLKYSLSLNAYQNEAKLTAMSLHLNTIITLNSSGDLCTHSIKPKESTNTLLTEESLLGLQNLTLNEICVENRI